MPLPEKDTPWPPAQIVKILHTMDAWDAWYVGDGDRLSVHYQSLTGGIIGGTADQGIMAKPGLLGRVARWFWGQPQTGLYRSKLHVPIAADLCQAGADLLYSEPPTFTVDHSATQDRLNDLTDDTMNSVFGEAAELGGALGGSYLRVAWDKSIAKKPFLTSVSADGAVPEFSYGRLSAVMFWRVVARTDKAVWRHVERHELDTQGYGIILHGLYQGDDGSLGRSVPLEDLPATAPLAELVNEDSIISTESPGLAVVYIPNLRPQRRWRKDPIGTNLGRSFLDGIEPFMDALDEVYTSWMRDIRLGKTRVFIAQAMLDNLPAGQGQTFDADREIYAPLSIPPKGVTDGGGGLPIQAEQFKIRYQEHAATAAEWTEVILRTAGFSSQTFGMDESGRTSNLTATEVQARERRSYLTRDRMMRLQKPQLQTIVGKMLAVDKAIFQTANIEPGEPTVAFSDAVQESQITLAQTALALKQAEAASTKTLVQMIHPDWADDDVNTEVGLILSEAKATTTVPEFAPPELDPNDPASLQ